MKLFLLAALAMQLAIAVTAQTTDSLKSSRPGDPDPRIRDLVQKLYTEQDGKKAELIAADIVHKIDTDPAWSGEKSKRDTYRIHPLYAYLNAADYDGFKRFRAALGEVRTERIHFATAGYVRRVTKAGINLKYATELIRKEREWAKKRMTEVESSKENNGYGYAYALFTMDYARVLYRRGIKKNVLDLAMESNRYNRQRKDPDLINAYLTIAADFVKPDVLKKEMEAFIADGMSTAEIIARLKTIYVKEKGNENGFEDYIASFNKDHVKDKIESLKTKMLDEVAPDFSLRDLNGNVVSLKDLKGKIVILDFWATWCGPCKASFPSMQVMVNKYRKDPNIQFLFVATLEPGENKEKKVGDYINSSKYKFQVLMDNSNEMAKNYNVTAIPAKFVIDKRGKLRFRVAGFTNDAELMDEMEAMIQLSK